MTLLSHRKVTTTWQFTCNRCHVLNERQTDNPPLTWTIISEAVHLCFDCTLNWERFKRGESLQSAIITRKRNDDKKIAEDKLSIKDIYDRIADMVPSLDPTIDPLVRPLTDHETRVERLKYKTSQKPYFGITDLHKS